VLISPPSPTGHLFDWLHDQLHLLCIPVAVAVFDSLMSLIVLVLHHRGIVKQRVVNILEVVHLVVVSLCDSGSSRVVANRLKAWKWGTNAHTLLEEHVHLDSLVDVRLGGLREETAWQKR
jgi:hypothetical protein